MKKALCYILDVIIFGVVAGGVLWIYYSKGFEQTILMSLTCLIFCAIKRNLEK